jgi:hypothetical protein
MRFWDMFGSLRIGFLRVGESFLCCADSPSWPIGKLLVPTGGEELGFASRLSAL